MFAVITETLNLREKKFDNILGGRRLTYSYHYQAGCPITDNSKLNNVCKNSLLLCYLGASLCFSIFESRGPQLSFLSVSQSFNLFIFTRRDPVLILLLVLGVDTHY